MPDDRIPIRETFMKPTPEYPDGSYLREVNGEVEMATGYFAKQHPGKPPPYWHGKAPVVLMDVVERKPVPPKCIDCGKELAEGEHTVCDKHLPF